MKKINSTFLLLVFLLAVSLAFYMLQLMQFQSPRDTAFYFLQDMAFLPLQVAIVTIVIGKILNYREKRERLKKTNMMLGAFFSEVGNDLLEQLNKLHVTQKELKGYLNVKETWSNQDFKVASQAIIKHDLKINCTSADLLNLKTLLSEKRYFILLMLGNPNLLEHETFTDLLWAIFHLTDELLGRNSFAELPKNDMDHLNYDVLRAFKAILTHWISYMSHLKSDYPYLFSIELRKNAFNDDKSIVIE